MIRGFFCGCLVIFTTRLHKFQYSPAQPSHVAVREMLDELERRGILTWEWGYEQSSTLYKISVGERPSKTYGSREAEELAQRFANEQRIIWIPVPHYGSEENWAATVDLISEIRAGLLPKPWERQAGG